MPRDVRAYLWDIQSAAAAIERFVAGIDAEAYARSEVIHSAVERKFEIIAFRNLLIHGYAVVEHTRVLKIVETSLPGLQACVADLLDELGPL